MGAPPNQVARSPVTNFAEFWARLGRLVAALIRDRAHGEVTLFFSEGRLPTVRVNRNYKPENLPEI